MLATSRERLSDAGPHASSELAIDAKSVPIFVGTLWAISVSFLFITCPFVRAEPHKQRARTRTAFNVTRAQARSSQGSRVVSVPAAIDKDNRNSPQVFAPADVASATIWRNPDTHAAESGPRTHQILKQQIITVIYDLVRRLLASALPDENLGNVLSAERKVDRPHRCPFAVATARRG